MKPASWLIILLTLAVLLSGCGAKAEGGTGYEMIGPEEAKTLMDQGGAIILDVRTQQEYDQGHIPGAILLPDYQVKELAEEYLPDKEQLILVYCRSGNRSKKASETLADMGYTNVKEFGGINDWPYDIT